MVGCNFRNVLPINVPKYNGEKIQVFWWETSKIYVNLHSGTWSVHFHHRHCGSHEYAHSRDKQPQRNLHNSQGFSQNAKSCNYARKTIPLVLHSVAPNCFTFLVKMWERIWSPDDRKRSSLTRICLRHCSYPFADDWQPSSRVQHCWRRKSSHATMLCL